MMQKTWQLVRIELVRKWPFVAILLVLWLATSIFVASVMRSRYGTGGAVDASDAAGPIVVIFSAFASLIFGTALFQLREKDGLRFFLYHHPASRIQLYLVRWLTGAAMVALLCGVTILLTPTVFSTSWSAITEGHLASFISFVACLCLLAYTVAAFLSPLSASDLATVVLSAICSFVLAVGLGFWGQTSLSRPKTITGLLTTLLLGTAVILPCGLWLFRRRWILEHSWGRRAAYIAVFFVAACAVVLVLNFVDFVDLLYLMGIDLMAWG